MGNIWEIYWKYMGNIWEIYRKYMENILKIYGNYMENTLRIHGKCMEKYATTLFQKNDSIVGAFGVFRYGICIIFRCVSF